MARLTRLSILGPLALAAALPLGACQHAVVVSPTPEVVVAERGGPPPHAPAHGYRRKQKVAHGELELVFDAGLGVYVVVGFPDLYFLDDHYYRRAASGWEVSLHHDSGWTVAVQSDVPAGLRDAKPGNAKGGKKGPGPAKHRD